MGLTKRAKTGPNDHSDITDFWPDDTDTKMYIDSSAYVTMEEIAEKIKEKWPEAEPSQINIGAEQIHTHCLYYDRYDPSDWTQFLVLEYDRK